MENTSFKINPTNYRRRPLPSKPPKVQEYYGYNIETRRNMNQKPEEYRAFWLDPEVKAYFDSRDRIIADNWSHRRFLMQLKAEAEAKGEETGLIDSVLSDFDKPDYLFPIELRGQEDVPEEVQAVANSIGGSVSNYRRKEWE